MSPLRAAPIREALASHPFYTRIVVADRLTSTNDEARRLASGGADEGTVVLADAQSAGRGRHGREWLSAPGMGLYLSVVLRPRDPLELVTRWTLGASVAACQACRRMTGEPVEIDWPNDLAWGGRKLAGILAEMRSAGGIAAELILGLGINVHHGPDDLPREIAERATSLHLIGGRGILRRESLAVDYLVSLADVAEQLRRGGWPGVVRRWESLAPNAHGRRGRVLPGRGEAEAFVGVTRGLAADGALVVEDDSGRLHSVRMADAFVPLPHQGS